MEFITQNFEVTMHGKEEWKKKSRKKSEGRLENTQSHLSRKQPTVLQCELKMPAAEASFSGLVFCGVGLFVCFINK